MRYTLSHLSNFFNLTFIAAKVQNNFQNNNYKAAVSNAKKSNDIQMQKKGTKKKQRKKKHKIKQEHKIKIDTDEISKFKF